MRQAEPTSSFFAGFSLGVDALPLFDSLFGRERAALLPLPCLNFFERGAASFVMQCQQQVAHNANFLFVAAKS